MRTLLILALSAAMLSGCIVVPERPAYYHPAVVVY
jgi:hypothetical protein